MTTPDDKTTEATPLMEAATKVLAALDDLTTAVLNEGADALEEAARKLREGRSK